MGDKVFPAFSWIQRAYRSVCMSYKKGFPGTNPILGMGFFLNHQSYSRGETRHGTLTLNDFLSKESPLQGLPLPSLSGSSVVMLNC